MTLVPRIRLLFSVLSFVALVGLISFNSSVFAQTASYKPDPNSHVYTIAEAPDGSSFCRAATVQERKEMFDQESAQPLHLINHLDDNQKGASAQVNDPNLSGLKIFLLATDQLEAFPEAKAAFIRAALDWEARIKSPITIYLKVDYGTTNFGSPWGSASVIGATRTLSSTVDYPSVRNNLNLAASNASESALYSLLPQTSIPTDVGSGGSGTMSVNTSVARALGLRPANATEADPMARIGFNSAFAFDFNPDDGINAQQTDFVAVAIHEIGHALGFDSSNGEGGTPPRLSTWDLFRFRPGVTDFTNTPRIMTVGGGLQIFYAGGGELGLSTGGPDPNPGDGDGAQSSHWRDDKNVPANYIGIMDPTIPKGKRENITIEDERALNFMGYNMESNAAPPPPPPPPPAPANNNFANAQIIIGCTGSVNGTNIGANKETGEPSHSPDNNPGGASVWYLWQAPSTGSVTIDTSGSNYDTLLAVYTGNSVSALNLIARNDDVVSGTVSSKVTFTATAGTIYRVTVDGYDNNSGGDTGNIVLNWTQTGCTATPPPPPPPPTLQLGQSTYNLSEGSGSLNVLVNRTGDPSLPLTVNYTTSDSAAYLQDCNVINNQATSRCDYVAVVGKLHFAATELSKTISIPIVDDTYSEGTENLSISLSNPTGGATLGTFQAPIQITDNDSPGQANPINNPTFFVRQHYIDFLSREPDPASAGWVTQLGGCGAGDQSCRISVSQGIYGSPEFKDRGYFIYKFFSVSFGRKPSYDEFNVDRARVSGFQTDTELEQSKVDFIAAFMARAEFANAYNGLSNDAYVQKLFTTAGVAQVSVPGLGVLSVAGMQQQLNAGRVRSQVLRDIAESPEVSAAFLTESTVVMHYFGYLRRDPDAAYQTWITILTTTGNSRNVTDGFINSPEYRARFSQ